MTISYEFRGYPATTEPADPTDPDHQARRDTRMAPQAHVDKIPDAFKECGCGDCPPGADPLAENDSGESVADICESPRPVTLEKATRTYITYDRASWNHSKRTSRFERHKKTYAKLLEADRTYMRKYDGLTTAMVTRRIAPTTPDGEWITPSDMLEFLFACNIHRKMRNSISYRLKECKNIEYFYVRVIAPTKSTATPHEHWYIWAHDPEDTITTADFAPALDKHLEYCPLATEEDHQYEDDGSDGAITVRHNPPVTDEQPAKYDNIDWGNNGHIKSNGYQTQGAQYLASQLAYLPLGNLFDGSRPNPYATLMDGAAICWMSNYNWYSSSQGI